MSRADRSRLPGLGPEPGFKFPAIERTTLASGLRVWTVEHHDLPVVALLLMIPVGSAADPVDRPGLASLTADMLDEGCGERSAIEVHEALAGIGAQFDLEVGADATILHLTTLARFTERGLAILGDMLGQPWFAEKEFTRVRDLRLHRLVQMRDMPGAVADRVFCESLYRDHPYGHLPIGTESSLRGVTLEEAATFHRRHHAPSGATLIGVGDATHAELVAAAGRAFASWSGRSGAANEAVVGSSPDFAVSTSKLVLVNRPRAAQSELRIGHIAVARTTPDYHALLVLNMILGGQFVSRINLNLREGKGYTYGARTWFDFRRSPGPFCLQTSVQTDATADAIREVFHEIRVIGGERPPTAEELLQSRAALTRGYLRGFETSEQIARAAGQLALYGLPDDYFDQFRPRVAAVDAEAVTQVAHAHLHADRLVTVVVGDRDTIAKGLSSLELGEPAEVAVG